MKGANAGPILKGLKKRHDVGQGAFFFFFLRNRLKVRKNLAFHGKIGFEITVSGGDLFVAEPQCDDLQGNTWLKQVHGGRMPDRMR